MNRHEIIGHLGQSPDYLVTEKGLKILKFSVATNRNRKDKNTGEWIKNTDWHNVVVFGKRAELGNLELYKGAKVRVEGPNVTRSYEDKQGNKKYISELIAYNYDMIAQPTPQTSTSVDMPPPAEMQESSFTNDEIPF